MSAQNRSDIHRYLDEVFAGVVVTPDLQDLKEELRGNLMARAAELQTSGASPAAAARTAIDELGDVHELIAEAEADAGEDSRQRAQAGSSTESGSVGSQNMLAELRRNRVRPKPAYVLHTVLLSIVLAASTAVVALAAFGVLQCPTVLAVVFGAVIGGIALGVIVADGVHQETTQSYPLPAARSVLFGAASGAGFAALALIALYPLRLDQVWLVIAGVPLAIIALLLFVWLGVTQTNRKKRWVVAAAREWAGEDRFSQDPVAAARFGIYTAVIWILAFAAFVVLSFTIGFLWSWLALLAGFVIFFLLLARMLFPADRKDRHHA